MSYGTAAYRLGYGAALDGQERGCNPYDDELETDLFELWDEGWIDAMTDDDLA